MPANDLTRKRRTPSCIWCGSTPLSREHLWPEWFSRLVPKTKQSHEHSRINVQFREDVALIQPSLIKRAGDPASLQLKVVCAPCNRNWMSKVENEARKVLEPLILGAEGTLSPEHQRVIANWTVLKTIIGEYDDMESVTVDINTRRAFYREQRIEGGWKIWIGKYIGKEWITRRQHRTFYVGPRPLTKSLSTIHKNAQCTTMAGGQLFIHVMSAQTPFLEPFGFKGETGEMLFQVYPAQNVTLKWPPKLLMGDDDANFVSQALRLSFQMANEEHDDKH